MCTIRAQDIGRFRSLDQAREYKAAGTQMTTTNILAGYAVSLDQVDGVDLDVRPGRVMVDHQGLPTKVGDEREISGTVDFDPTTKRLGSAELTGSLNSYSLSWSNGFLGLGEERAVYHQEWLSTTMRHPSRTTQQFSDGSVTTNVSFWDGAPGA